MAREIRTGSDDADMIGNRRHFYAFSNRLGRQAVYPFSLASEWFVQCNVHMNTEQLGRVKGLNIQCTVENMTWHLSKLPNKAKRGMFVHSSSKSLGLHSKQILVYTHLTVGRRARLPRKNQRLQNTVVKGYRN